MKQLGFILLILLGVLFFFFRSGETEDTQETTKNTHKIDEENISTTTQKIVPVNKTLYIKEETTKTTKPVVNKEEASAHNVPLQDTVIIKAEETIPNTIEETAKEKIIIPKAEKKLSTNEINHTKTLEGRTKKRDVAVEKNREENRKVAYERREAQRISQQEQRAQRIAHLEEETKKRKLTSTREKAQSARIENIEAARISAQKINKNKNILREKERVAREKMRQISYNRTNHTQTDKDAQ